ncbi:MAG: hypothetical protein L6V93_06270 [Clostridiales bacterium]|nr:MAG: hypothetical protein L6V93_06270 [Clostridiales bacterium]
MSKSAIVINANLTDENKQSAAYSQPIIFKTTSGASTTIASITTVSAGIDGETDSLEYNLGIPSSPDTMLKYRTGGYFQEGTARKFNTKYTTSTATNTVSTKSILCSYRQKRRGRLRSLHKSTEQIYR